MASLSERTASGRQTWKGSDVSLVLFQSVHIYFPSCEDAAAPSGGDSTYWPSSSVLTARLRRLITASQRFTKSRQIMQIHQSQSQTQQAVMLSAPLYPLPSAVNDVLNPKMAAKIERQQRSERREATPPEPPHPLRRPVSDSGVCVLTVTSCSPSDGRGGRRPTSTAWCPPSAWSSTPVTAASTGPSSGPWRGCTRRPTRACRSTCALSPPCADGCVACRPKKEVSRTAPAPERLLTASCDVESA